MALTKYKIGDLIESYSERCGIENLSPNDISGISIDKEFLEPAKQVGDDTSAYKVVPPTYFACNLMHVGRDIVLPIALNHTNSNKIVSPAYSVFKIKDESILLKEYFYILLKSTEKDRYFWFHTDSSIRQGLPWSDFCDIPLFLPSLSTQRRYVDVYLSMQDNLQQYQSRLSDLKLTCDAYIENLRRTLPSTPIGAYIEEVNVRNTDNAYTLDDIKGISTEKSFIETKANMDGVSLDSYKVVKPSEFAFVPDTSRRGDKIAAAYNDMEKGVLISSIYTTFKVNRPDVLIADYLFMFLNRPEFDRYARYHSWGSAREVFTMDDMCNVSIPIPSLSIQREIVDIYACYLERQRIASELKSTLSRLCPLLIRGSLSMGNNS